ncbi:GGDEF domain-containing protein [Nitratireductor thuwali]|uniref:diguanylate cyclase n=1 Tax=Nitratireductor thuwali TaxID=2267699 RepID=A0ABY5MPN0_9HYPH|nr:putative diguanylate cyclase YdaM [Nitratireductor thuwali]
MSGIDGLYGYMKEWPIWRQGLMITAIATVAAEALTLFFYSIFFADRLLLDLFLTAVITIAIAFPIACMFLRQTAKVFRLAEELDHAARTDYLTGLKNRREFMILAEKTLSEARNASAGALLYIDIDHFKRINDHHGHATGDRVIQFMGEAIRAASREVDIAARLGGEEFVVLLPDVNLEQARRVCDRIHRACREAGRTAGVEGLQTSVSIGLSMHRAGQSVDEVLSEADAFLYEAKRAGRDQIMQSVPIEIVA